MPNIQRFGEQVGEPAVVNTLTAGTQQTPALTALANGGFAAVWVNSSGGVDVRVQRLDSNGQRVGTEIIVSQPGGGSPSLPSITGTPDGGFIVSWADTVAGSMARIYGSDGNPASAAFVVQEASAGSVFINDVAVLPDGHFMVVWQSRLRLPDGSFSRDVHGRVYDATGMALTPDFIVSSSTDGGQFSPRLAAANGRFVVVWQDDRPVSGLNLEGEILAQRFDTNGQRVGDELRINPPSVLYQSSPEIAFLDDGGFVVIWRDFDGNVSLGISAQRFDQDGNPVGSLIDVTADYRATYGSSVQFDAPAIASDGQGGFVISWGSVISGQSSSNQYQIAAQLFDMNGIALGPVTQVTSLDTSIRLWSTLASGSDGNLAIAWYGQSPLVSGQPPAGFDIHLARFDVYERLQGTDNDDEFNHTSGRPVVYSALNGNDIIHIFSGDQIDAGPGADVIISSGVGVDAFTYYGATVWGGDGNDNISGVGTAFYGEDGEDILTLTNGSGYLHGGDGNDTLIAFGDGGFRTSFVSIDGGNGDDSISAYGAFTSLHILIGSGSNNIDIDVSGSTIFFIRHSYLGHFNANLRSSNFSIISSIDAGIGDFILANGVAASIGHSNIGGGQEIISVNATVKNVLIFSSFKAGEAGTRLDLSAFGVDPFGSGRLSIVYGFNPDGVGVTISDSTTGSRFILNGVTIADLSTYNLGVSTGQFMPRDQTFDGDSFGVSPDYLIGGDGNDTIRGLEGDDILWGGAGNDKIDGGLGNDQLIGGSGDDLLRLDGGGSDGASGGTGNDGFYFGAAYDPTDVVDGGAGTLDQIGLQGDYSAGIALNATSAVGIEQFVLLPGSDTRFGVAGNPTLGYNLITGDAAIAAGQQLVFQANTLRAGENFTLDASGELDGSVFTYGGLGSENLRGSQNADAFFFGSGRFNASDVVDGQGGSDQIGLQGTYSGANAITFGATQLANVEFIVCLSNNDSRFGGAGSGTPYSYTLTMNNGNVAAGATLIIQANALVSDEVLTFNGAAELDGHYTIYSGDGADSIIAGALADTISGRGGADNLTGGGGNDSFLYTNLTDSIAAAQDHILDFTSGDVIDLSRLDAIAGEEANDAFTFIGAGAFSNTAGQLRAVNTAGNDWLVEADLNGDGVADLSILVTAADAHVLSAGDFSL